MLGAVGFMEELPAGLLSAASGRTGAAVRSQPLPGRNAKCSSTAKTAGWGRVRQVAWQPPPWGTASLAPLSHLLCRRQRRQQ